MKKCPRCGTQYSDNTLRFCLQDGTPLEGPDGDMATAVLGEVDTADALRNVDGMRVPVNVQGPPPSQVTRVADHGQDSKRPNTATAVILTIVGMLFLFGVAGFAALIYFRGQTPQIVQNITPNINTAPNRTVAAVNDISPTPRKSPAATPAVPANRQVDDPQMTREVTQTLNDWKTQSEAIDVNAYMAHYAPVVDYYNKPGVSAAYVRSDKLRAFSRYDSIHLDLTNMNVTPDTSGQAATAIFDKEWDFEGAGRSSGKVRQMMRLAKINGQWLITAEKDLKLYYKR